MDASFLPFLIICAFFFDYRQIRLYFCNGLTRLRQELLESLPSEYVVLCNEIIDEYKGYTE